MKTIKTTIKSITSQPAIKSALLLFLAAGFLISCKDDDGTPPINEEELITTIILNMTETGTTNVATASFRDVDGPGGNAPTVTDIVLKPNTVYHTEIRLLDESKTPPAVITEEIAEEDEDHQFFYTPTTVNLTVAYQDQDQNNLPVGLKIFITTGAASTGKLRVTLKHQPGIKNNNIATGETDLEVDFNVRVE